VNRNMGGLIRLVNFAAFAGVLALASPASFAQAAAPAEPPASSVLSVPTTKILAIGSFPGASWLPARSLPYGIS
jgi:hypothetical protein